VCGNNDGSDCNKGKRRENTSWRGRTVTDRGARTYTAEKQRRNGERERESESERLSKWEKGKQNRKKKTKREKTVEEEAARRVRCEYCGTGDRAARVRTAVGVAKMNF